MKKINWIIAFLIGVMPQFASAQEKISTENWLSSPGIIGTFVLIAIVMAVAVIILLVKLNSYIDGDRKSTRLNSSHVRISYAVFCLKKKKNKSIYTIK